MTSAKYQQVIENFYEKVVAINFERLKKSIDASMAEGLSIPMPMEVLVVIAILAITIFRPKIQELWDAIASGINSL